MSAKEVPHRFQEPRRESSSGRPDIGKILLDFSAQQNWKATGLMGDDLSFRDRDGMRSRFVYSDGIFQCGKAIGLGDTEFAFEGRLRTDKRVTYVGLTKTTYEGEDLLTISGSDHLHQYRPEIILNKKTGFWVPNVLESKGQRFSVIDNSSERFPPGYTQHGIDEKAQYIGKEKAALLFGTERENYSLVTASFLPNHNLTEARGGGRVTMQYFWDRKEGTLSLESTKTEHLRVPSWRKNDEPVVKDSDWQRFNAATGDKHVVVQPFGIYEIPGTIDELTWFQDFMFPPTYSWSDPEKGGKIEDNWYTYNTIFETEGTVGYNIFGINQLETWGDFTNVS